MVNRLVKESDTRASIIRTIVPLLVGLVLTLALRAGFDLSDWTAQISSVVTAIVSALYYSVARWLEVHVSDKFGWLLGLRAKPSYDLAA